MSAIDPHSFSNPEEIIIRHIDLDLNVDFDSSFISGTATLSLENLTGTDTLCLDTRDLIIEKVENNSNISVNFTLGQEVKYLGKKLSIPVAASDNKIKITYRTSPQAAALQWLQPQQTAGGKHPFLFTQSQAILARTWLPLQDSPSVRFTYKARVKVPAGLMAVMSAENDTVINKDGIYNFSMPQAIPSYLMALSVGDFRYHSYDNRCGVFAEPVTLASAANEFSDMPRMISAAEELYGKYAWGKYDVLVLPPSFPFGGMENPRVTFATPTILAGDKSLVALIAHELAHSWSGNLVTNATWNDFWLNEGFTVYFESRIMEKIYGKSYSDMMTVLSKGELLNTIENFGVGSPDTQLKLKLDNRDPDDGMNDIAYEKGRFFLLMLEQYAGRQKWDAFVSEYFHSHAFQSMTTEKFVDILKQKLFSGDPSAYDKLKVDEWIYKPGLPDNCPEVTSAELDRAANAAKDFMNGKKAADLDTKGWTTHHWIYFLRQLQLPVSTEKMKDLDNTFHLTSNTNSEILFQWLSVSIRSGYNKETDASLERFLTTVGRRKFVAPLFAALIQTPEGKLKAEEIYSKARKGYHAVTVQTVDEMLEWNKEAVN